MVGTKPIRSPRTRAAPHAFHRRDPEQARIGKRIAQNRLKYNATQGERRADNSGKNNARQTHGKQNQFFFGGRRYFAEKRVGYSPKHIGKSDMDCAKAKRGKAKQHKQ